MPSETIAIVLSLAVAVLALALANWVMLPRWDRDPGKRVYFYAVGVGVIGLSWTLIALVCGWPDATILWLWGVIAVAGVTTLSVRFVRDHIDLKDKEIARKGIDEPEGHTRP